MVMIQKQKKEIQSGRVKVFEYFDWNKGEYIDATVNDIYRSKGSVTIEIEDDDTGEEHTFEMDNK